MRALLLRTALNAYLDGLDEGFFLDLLLLLLEILFSDDLLEEAKSRRERPIEKNATGRNPAHPDEEDDHHHEHHDARSPGLLTRRLEERHDRGRDGHDHEEHKEKDVGERIADAFRVESGRHGNREVGNDVVEAHSELATSEVTQFVPQNLEQDDEDGELDEHRQTAGHRVEAGLLIDLHGLFGDFLLIASVFLLNLQEFGLQLLHLEIGHVLAALQGEKNKTNHQSDDDDGEAPVADELSQLVQQPRCPVENVIPHLKQILSRGFQTLSDIRELDRSHRDATGCNDKSA